MWFLIKACFWLGLVFILLPPAGGPSGPRPTAPELPSVQAVAREAATLCRGYADFCPRAVGTVVEFATAAAPDQARGRDTLTASDRAPPFAGLEPPSGEAPRQAPLPPRRPG